MAKTNQIGFNIPGGLSLGAGVGGKLSIGYVYDDKGGKGFYGTFYAGVAAGKSNISVGIEGINSNARNINELNGRAMEVIFDGKALGGVPASMAGSTASDGYKITPIALRGGLGARFTSLTGPSYTKAVNISQPKKNK